MKKRRLKARLRCLDETVACFSYRRGRPLGQRADPPSGRAIGWRPWAMLWPNPLARCSSAHHGHLTFALLHHPPRLPWLSSSTRQLSLCLAIDCLPSSPAPAARTQPLPTVARIVFQLQANESMVAPLPSPSTCCCRLLPHAWTTLARDDA